MSCVDLVKVRTVCAWGLAMALALAAGAAGAEERLEASPAAEPVPEADALEIANREFSRIAAERELLQARIELLEAQARFREAQAAASGEGGVAAAGQPVLIGIYTAGDQRFAEFAVGQGTRRVRQGGLISEGLRLEAVEGDSVLVMDTGSRARSRMFINKRTAQPVGGRTTPLGQGPGNPTVMPSSAVQPPRF